MSINLITTSLGIHHGQVEWDQLSDIIANFAHFDTNKINLKKTLFIEPESIENELNNIDTYLQAVSEDDRNIIDQLIRHFPEDNSIDSLILRLSKQGVLNFSELNLLAQVLEKGLFLKQSFKHLDLPLMQY